MGFFSPNQCYGFNHSFARMCLLVGTVSQMSDEAYGHLACMPNIRPYFDIFMYIIYFYYFCMYMYVYR